MHALLMIWYNRCTGLQVPIKDFAGTIGREEAPWYRRCGGKSPVVLIGRCLVLVVSRRPVCRGEKTALFFVHRLVVEMNLTDASREDCAIHHIANLWAENPALSRLPLPDPVERIYEHDDVEQQTVSNKVAYHQFRGDKQGH